MANEYQQRYSASDTSTAGGFLFDDDDAGKDIGVSKIVFGADGAAITRVSGGNGTAATALRVTLASDSTGVVAATQSGTWTVQPGNTANTTAWLVTGTGGTFPVTDNGGSLTIDAPVGTPAFVRLSDGSSAITTLPVSLASVPSHAVTNAGTFAVQVDGAALTALQLIDDAVYVDDVPFTAGSSKIMVTGFRYDDVTPDTVQQGDVGYARMSSRREVFVTLRDAAGNERGLNVDASGNITANITGTVTVGSHNVTNAGTFAVQSTLQAGTAYAGKVRLTDGTTDAEVVPLTGYNAQAVAIVDGSGAQITSFGGGTQYAEGDTDASITGTVAMWEDAANTLVATSATKPLPVEIISGSSSGTQYTEDAAAAANPVGTVPMLVRIDAPGGITSDDGDMVAQRGTNYGASYVTILNNAGTSVDFATETTLSSLNGKVTACNTGAVVISSALPAGTNLLGRMSSSDETSTIYNGTTALTPKYAVIAASSSGNNTIVAAVTSKKIRVVAYNFIGNGAVNAKFQSGASGTDLTGLKYIAAAGGGICAPYNKAGWFETASGVLLNLNLSGAVAVGGELVYVEV